MARQITQEEYKQFKIDYNISNDNSIEILETYPNGDYNKIYKLNQYIFLCMEIYLTETNENTYWIFLK